MASHSSSSLTSRSAKPINYNSNESSTSTRLAKKRRGLINPTLDLSESEIVFYIISYSIWRQQFTKNDNNSFYSAVSIHTFSVIHTFTSFFLHFRFILHLYLYSLFP